MLHASVQTLVDHLFGRMLFISQGNLEVIDFCGSEVKETQAIGRFKSYSFHFARIAQWPFGGFDCLRAVDSEQLSDGVSLKLTGR